MAHWSTCAAPLCFGEARKASPKDRYGLLLLSVSFCVTHFLNFMQTTRHLEKMVDDLNAGKPQCPVGLNTLVLPRKSTLPPPDQTPYVYLKCGHVQGLHHWGKAGEERTCPICLKVRFGILTNRIRTQSWSSFVWGSNIRKMVVHLIAGWCWNLYKCPLSDFLLLLILMRNQSLCLIFLIGWTGGPAQHGIGVGLLGRLWTADLCI